MGTPYSYTRAILEAPTASVVAEVDDELVGFVIARRRGLELEVREVVMGPARQTLSDVFALLEFALEHPDHDDLEVVRISSPAALAGC